MHELGVTQAMLDLVLQYADGHRITVINLRLGQAASVVRESVELYFDYLSKGTLAEGARLCWEIVPLEITCQVCGRQVDLGEWADERPNLILSQAIERGCTCGSHKLRMSEGTGFGVASLEVAE
jgi:hydrogenase nickel incorporation protein HypA/HybF